MPCRVRKVARIRVRALAGALNRLGYEDMLGCPVGLENRFGFDPARLELLQGKKEKNQK